MSTSASSSDSMGEATKTLNSIEMQLDAMQSVIGKFDTSDTYEGGTGGGATLNTLSSKAVLSSSVLGMTVWDATHRLVCLRKEVSALKEEAGGVESSQGAAFLDRCNYLRQTAQVFFVDSGVWALCEVHTVRTRHEYLEALQSFSEWVRRQRILLLSQPSSETSPSTTTEGPTSHSSPFGAMPRKYGATLDAFELRVAEDFLSEQWEWAGYAKNVAAPLWELDSRLTIMKDIRQQVQEERDRAAAELQADDYALATHLNPAHRASAIQRRRFQLLQHLSTRALSLKHSQPAGLSLAQRYRAANVSQEVLHWIDVVQGFAVDNDDNHANKPPASTTSSLLDSGFTENLAVQLDKLLQVVSDVAAPADIIARQNELASLEDYVRSAMVHPTLSTCIDNEDLRRLLDYLQEWRDAFPQGTTAAGYDTIIEVFMNAAHRCGLSVLAGRGTSALEEALSTKPPVVSAGFLREDSAPLTHHHGMPTSPISSEGGSGMLFVRNSTSLPAVDVEVTLPTSTPSAAHGVQKHQVNGEDEDGEDARSVADTRKLIDRAVLVGCNLSEALQQLRVQLSVSGASIKLPVGQHGAPPPSERRAEARRIAKEDLMPLHATLTLALDTLGDEEGISTKDVVMESNASGGRVTRSLRELRMAANKVLGPLSERTEALANILKSKYALDIPSSCWLLILEARSM